MMYVQEKMGKIAGRFICLFFIFFMVVPICTKIRMRAKTIDGERIEQAVVGQPFVLEVTIKDASSTMRAPTVYGLDRFEAKRTGMYMSSINGKSTVKYSYQVRIDRPGMYTIGPARLDDNGNQMESGTITLEVSNQQVGKHRKQRRAQEVVLLRLSVAKDRVVVGERVPCTLRFYYKNPKLELTRIGKPDIKWCAIKKQQKPMAGKAHVNGTSYHYVEWQWDLYPQKEGDVIVPAYHVDYTLESKRDHFFGSFSVMFGPRRERKRVYSNSVCLQVDLLPEYNGTVHAIGDFNAARATITPAVAKEGEGMVLSIELEGDGDLEAVATPQLVNIPEELKYYDSNSSIIAPKSDDTFSKKRFEYIVQGRSCGEWEIPGQTFTYFDVNMRMYKKLKTSPLLVTITPNVGVQTIIMPKNSENTSDVKTSALVAAIRSIHHNGPWFPVNQRNPLPWWLFGLLCFAPVMVMGYKSVNEWFAQKSSIGNRYKKAFYRARAALKRAHHDQDQSRIYQIFIQLVADRTDQSVASIYPELISNQLYVHMNDDVVAMWQQFFDRAIQIAFGTNKLKQIDKAFFEMAEQWIDRFEKIL